MTVFFLNLYNRLTHRQGLPGRKRVFFRLYVALQVLLFVLINLGFYTWILKPKFHVIQTLDQQMAGADQTILRTEQEIAQCKRTLSMPQSDFDYVDFEQANQDNYLDILVQPLDALDLELVNVALKEDSPTSNLLIRSGIMVDVKGDYKSLGEYLFALESVSVLHRISTLSIAPDPGSPSLIMSLTLDTYLTHL